MMGASQIDQYGNQNIACIGSWERPKAQLLGVRGAPGNTINHVTSYWIPDHNPRVLVARVDLVSGVGYDRARALGPQASRFHEIRRVITNLGVFDFETPDRRMRVVSLHPGVERQEVIDNTGFELIIPDRVDTTAAPDGKLLELLRELDPRGLAQKEVAA
jgi:acyl CoA:acetate/3-ketoacid CoA transferase beta subunit